MKNEYWMNAAEARHALGDLSKSGLSRRTQDLHLMKRGYAVKLGRRLLYSSTLISDLPDILASLPGKEDSENVR